MFGRRDDEDDDVPSIPKLSRQSTSNFHPSYHNGSSNSSASEKSVFSSRITTKKRALSTGRLQFALGGSTHPGGSTVKPNQDDYFIWKSKFDHTIVLGVLDGHGREVGDLASRTAKKAFLEEFEDKETFALIRKDPLRAFKLMFARVHRAIWNEFEAHYKGKGWNVREVGNIMMKKKTVGSWTCVHGGTTASIIVILDSHKVYVANVGDSSVVMGPQRVKTRPATYFCDEIDGDDDKDEKGAAVFSAKEITANHSPEEPSEYHRIRLFRSKPDDSTRPSLRFVYDSLNYSKSNCHDVFEHLDASGVRMRISGRGEYYKNVRQEWATLVCTPSSAKFQDALAFTRSLGDFHLQTYGVSHVPEVTCVDLHDLFREDGADDDEPLVILLASDGVWDNWRFADTIKEIQSIRQNLSDSSAPGGDSTACSSETICKQFMKKNLSLGLHNFGRQADNMTAITCIVTKPRGGRKRAVTGGGVDMVR